MTHTTPSAPTATPTFAIIGGGIMGMATAWHLATRGMNVHVLEQHSPGHHHGASHGSTRNLNNAYTETHYLDLYDEAFELWRALEEASGEQLLTLCGVATQGDPELLSEIVTALRSRDAPFSVLSDNDASARWPGMRFHGDVVLSERAGRIHSETALHVLTRLAREAGAVIEFGARALEVTELSHGVRIRAAFDEADTQITTLTADGVIVTAGAWTPEVLHKMPHIRLPQLIVTEEHPAHFAALRPLSEADEQQWWPSFNHLRAEVTDATARKRAALRNGSDSVTGGGDSIARHGDVYGMYTPGEGVKVGFHAVGDVVLPHTRRFRGSQLHREALRDYVAEWFPGLDADSGVEVSCTYTSTRSGDFVLDRVGAVTIGAGFSGHGFKFAPAIGRVLADAAMGVAFPPSQFRLAAHA